MKLYAVYEHWYNYCDQWNAVESYWLSEENAIQRLIDLEEEKKQQIGETYWIDYTEIETED